MKRLIFALVFLLGMTLIASAAPVSCLDASVTGKSVLDPVLANGCSLGGLIFDNFSVTGVPQPPGSSIYLTGGSSVIGNSVNLAFQITTPLPPSDTVFVYHVTGGLSGVDNSHNGQGSTRIQEIVCAVQPNASVCPQGSVVASLVNPPTTQVTFPSQSEAWIIKDIQLPNSQTNDFISSFVNSHETPEPTTSALVGAGLLAVAGITRKFRRT